MIKSNTDTDRNADAPTRHVVLPISDHFIVFPQHTGVEGAARRCPGKRHGDSGCSRATRDMNKASVIAMLKKKMPIIALALTVLIAVGAYYWSNLRVTGPGDGFIGGNGRIEATEVDVSTKMAGRVHDIIVNEGSFVKAGEPLAYMQIDVLRAQLAEAQAKLMQAGNNVSTARAQVAARMSEHVAALALIAQRESDLLAARQRLARSETLSSRGAVPRQTLDDDRAGVRAAQAVLAAAKAQAAAAQAGIDAAKAQVVSAGSAVTAAEATVALVQADIDDSVLRAPRDGRVQYRIAQPGEVLGNGGKVLNIIDLSDVYMTFFLPETVAGRVALGSEVRLVLDAAPQYVIPAKVSYVASTAQFTPKTVETASERQKLMFRIKARIDRDLLKKHLEQVKTGLPGMAWLRLDARLPWPPELALNVPE